MNDKNGSSEARPFVCLRPFTNSIVEACVRNWAFSNLGLYRGQYPVDQYEGVFYSTRTKQVVKMCVVRMYIPCLVLA